MRNPTRRCQNARKGAKKQARHSPPANFNPPSTILNLLSFPLSPATPRCRRVRLPVVLGIDQHAVLAEEDQVRPPVAGDIGDHRLARLRSRPLLASQAFRLEDLEMQRVP